MPAYENFKKIEGNWGNLYSGKPEDLTHSCPPTMGKPVLISRFVYAKLMANKTTGRYRTGIINLLNKTPHSGIPNYNLASKLPPMVVNMLPLIYLLTISLNFSILYDISAFHFTW